MKAKSGSAVNSVAPTAPEEVFAADDAKPGTVAKTKAKQTENQKGKYGSTKAPPFKPDKGSDSGSNASSGSSATSSNSNKAAPASTAASASNKSEPEKQSEKEKDKTDWIEIEFVGEDDSPISGEKYEVTLPDGSVASGTLDANGFARIEGFEPGKCKVSFPNLDADTWELA